MAFLAIILTSVLGTTLAFQATFITNKNQYRTTPSTYFERRSCSSTTQLASNNGGMDAFAAQLRAANAEAAAKNAGMDAFEVQLQAVDSYANDIMNESLSAVTLTDNAKSSQSSVTPHVGKTGEFAIAGLLMQRAIQTQLYYLSDLRDEPRYMWLRQFLSHDHLDDKGQFNELDGLRCNGGWQYYLEQLEQAPHFSITVQLAPPPMSAQQRRNPYLVKELSAGRSSEETIMPSTISQTLQTVARSLEREWLPVIAELAEEDRKRVELFHAPPQLQTAALAYQAYWQDRQVVAGGEGDDQDTPLHALNCRIVTRFCTRMALHRIIEELEGETATGSEDDEAKRAALDWLRDFAMECAPRLERGPDDDKRRHLGVAPPGHWQRLCDGADADDVTEAMWQILPPFTEASDDTMRLYSPGALSTRLRRVRAIMHIAHFLVLDSISDPRHKP